MKTAKQAEMVCKLFLISRANPSEPFSLRELEQKLGYSGKKADSIARKLLRVLQKQNVLSFSKYDFDSKTELFSMDEERLALLLRDTELFKLFYEVIYERSAILIDDTPKWADLWDKFRK